MEDFPLWLRIEGMVAYRIGLIAHIDSMRN
jgi:hypothetical protein